MDGVILEALWAYCKDQEPSRALLWAYHWTLDFSIGLSFKVYFAPRLVEPIQGFSIGLSFKVYFAPPLVEPIQPSSFAPFFTMLTGPKLCSQASVGTDKTILFVFIILSTFLDPSCMIRLSSNLENPQAPTKPIQRPGVCSGMTVVVS